jgi:hypothetical protein
MRGAGDPAQDEHSGRYSQGAADYGLAEDARTEIAEGRHPYPPQGSQVTWAAWPVPSGISTGAPRGDTSRSSARLLVGVRGGDR